MIFLGDSNAVHANIPGNRSEAGHAWSHLRMYEIYSHLEREKPDLFVFALGLNDLLNGADRVEYNGQEVNREHKAHMVMRNTIEQVRKHCDVAVCAVLGVELNNKYPNFRLSPKCWNKHIVKPACDELGAIYVPHFPNTIFEDDGIHIKNVQENADWVMKHFEYYW